MALILPPLCFLYLHLNILEFMLECGYKQCHEKIPSLPSLSSPVGSPERTTGQWRGGGGGGEKGEVVLP